MDDPKLILEICVACATLLAQFAGASWALSSAWGRMRSHDARLNRLENRSDGHGEQISNILLEVKTRLERIETTLAINAGERPGRRMTDRSAVSPSRRTPYSSTD